MEREGRRGALQRREDGARRQVTGLGGQEDVVVDGNLEPEPEFADGAELVGAFTLSAPASPGLAGEIDTGPEDRGILTGKGITVTDGALVGRPWIARTQLLHVRTHGLDEGAELVRIGAGPPTVSVREAVERHLGEDLPLAHERSDLGLGVG